MNIDKAGFLTKSPPLASVDGISVKRWTRRWFELQGSMLVYYAMETKEGGAKGQIDLCDTRRMYLEQPSCRHKFAFTIETETRTFFLKADSMVERCAWTKAIAAAVQRGTGNKAQVVASAAVSPIKFGDQPPPLTAAIEGDYCGYLVKSPTITKVDEVTHKRWQRRWFVLHGDFLYYFTGVDRADMKGAIDIKTCQRLLPNVKSAKRETVFSLQCDDREYFFQAESDDERKGWIGALVEAATAAGGSVPAEGDVDEAASAAAPELKPEPVPEPEPYTGSRRFVVELDGVPGWLQIQAPRLNLVQRVQRQTRLGRQLVDLTTHTWPLAQLWHSGYNEEDGIFSFAGGQLDDSPGKIYRFYLQPGDSIKHALNRVKLERRRKSRLWKGERPVTVRLPYVVLHPLVVSLT
mmetsp:Transcript_737/g.2400  ORF Transcript_737/g.2400 Transcript_737/m.2400 type:complete len:407 (-) Transcript_737:955-2175(-)